MKNQAITQVINSWAAQNKAISDIFNKFEEQYYNKEVAVGRNRAIYVLGHLVAMNDFLLPMLDIGEKLYPELEKTFVIDPDNTAVNLPSLEILKEHWETLNQTLSENFAKMEETDWLSRHMKVTLEDFAKDLARNKLNVLIGRTGHMNYHRGQLAFLTPRV